jgi:hypothetical protein
MAPRVSVVVPVRNRKALLAELLDALSAQTYRDFEVVIVDDGSDDGSGDEARGRVLGDGPALVVPGPREGAVAARIRGVAAASGEILAFTDSDCRPAPDWLERGIAALDAGADVVAGVTRPRRPPRPLERSVTSGPEGLYPTCNLFVRAAAYHSVGGFDPAAGARLGFRWSARARGLGFGEDTLLAWSLIRRGARPAFEPEAVVEHAVFPARRAELLGRAMQAGAFPSLLAEVPELRATLLSDRVFLGGPRRVPAYLGLLLAAVRVARLAAPVDHRALRPARRGRSTRAAPSPAAGLLLAAWAWGRAAEVRRAGANPLRRPDLVAAEMLTDLLTALALLAGSARARTLIL